MTDTPQARASERSSERVSDGYVEIRVGNRRSIFQLPENEPLTFQRRGDCIELLAAPLSGGDWNGAVEACARRCEEEAAADRAAWDTPSLADEAYTEGKLFCAQALRSLSRPSQEAEGWRDISTAPKDGNPILAVFHKDIFPRLKPGREDLERWNGVQVVIRHPGIAADGFDMGWNMAAPVGYGGFSDDWIAGWQPLPTPPRKA
jgi:hypothetical protein